MRIISAYLLAVLGGNDSPSAKDISNIISAVGISVDQAQVDKFIDEVKGKVCPFFLLKSPLPSIYASSILFNDGPLSLSDTLISSFPFLSFPFHPTHLSFSSFFPFSFSFSLVHWWFN